MKILKVEKIDEEVRILVVGDYSGLLDTLLQHFDVEDIRLFYICFHVNIIKVRCWSKKAHETVEAIIAKFRNRR
ncbi:MAG TPA: hypothetical protein ENF41_03400 [Candidatus Bathyarchaeota archaeon]|nr:hypothetical protein [Candidatus Bathyarchaeota archaeon]